MSKEQKATDTKGIPKWGYFSDEVTYLLCFLA